MQYAYRPTARPTVTSNNIVREPGGVSLAEKVTNFHVHSNLVHMPLSMELKVWLVIGGGCSQGGHDKGPPKLG